jgi:hypothetical protein
MNPEVEGAVSTPGSIGWMRRTVDVVLGEVTAIGALLLGLIIWGLLFDRTGVDRFSSTVFGFILMWPAVLAILIAGPFLWWRHRTLRRRVIIFAALVLATHAAIGISWLLF